MAKRIMILGAGRGQVDLIKCAKKSGYYTVVVSIDGAYPGFDYADEKCICDISDSSAVSDAAKRLRVDGIATACMDTGIAALGTACEENNLIGLSSKAAEISGNKLLMKQAFCRYGVSSPAFMKISSVADIESAVTVMDFPLIIKAVDLQGSRGISIARNMEELLSGFENAMSETEKDYCIVEEYIQGTVIGVEAFVIDGKILFLCPTGNESYSNNANIHIGHYIPLELPENVLASVEKETSLSIKACQLNNCAVDLDIIIKDGKAYIIEITGRLGANCLPELISVYYGIDIFKLIVETAMGNGKEAAAYFNSEKSSLTPCYSRMLLSEKSGIVKEIVNKIEENENIVDIKFFKRIGSKINKMSNSRDAIGQVVVKGTTVESAKAFIDKVCSEIEFVVE